MHSLLVKIVYCIVLISKLQYQIIIIIIIIIKYYDLLKVFDINNTMENEKFTEIYMYNEELLCETEESN